MKQPGTDYRYVVMQSAVAATGNGTAVTCTSTENGAYSVLTMQAVFTNTAVVTFEAMQDGTNWVAIPAINLSTGAVATTAAANGLYRCTVTGLTQARARVSSWTSGTVTVTGVLTVDPVDSSSGVSMDGVEALLTTIDADTSAMVLGVKDNGPSWTTSLGVAGVAFTSADASTAAAVTDAPTSGQKLVITDVVISVGATAMQVDLELETTGAVFYTFYLAANSTIQFTPRGKWKLPTANLKLMVDTSAAGAITVTALYYSEL